jgi:hypothetical protein
MYPRICVIAREPDRFTIEIHFSEDPEDHEVYYNGNNKEDATCIVKNLLHKHQTCLITADPGTPIKGYVFQIKRSQGTSRFFRTTDEVSNPFYNRKVYARMDPDSIASFHAVNL